MQHLLFEVDKPRRVAPFHAQLLKWIGNKQRYANEIVSFFPERFGTYFEPFLGSGAVLGTLAPERAVGSEVFVPLVEIWQTLHRAPETLNRWYSERWHEMADGEKVDAYEKIKASYNAGPNGADLVFLCRTCYGGVVRFRQADGYMSTPCGIHQPISPESFSRRVDEWYRRTRGTSFRALNYQEAMRLNYQEAMRLAKPGDLVYCDPPYTHSQSILYGAQSFSLESLFKAIADCRSRGVFVVLSIDGTKKSGNLLCDLPWAFSGTDELRPGVSSGAPNRPRPRTKSLTQLTPTCVQYATLVSSLAPWNKRCRTTEEIGP